MRIAELGMTKTAFYKLSGISSANNAQWNTGKYIPSKKKLSLAAKTLRASLDYILFGNEKTKNPPADSEGIVEEIIQRLLMLTPDELQKVDAFVLGLLAVRSV